MVEIKTWRERHLYKVIAPEKLEERCDEFRRLGKRIATLNGSFDLLHAGHLQIIFEGSQLADLLIVALNSDSSIRSYKGEKRPIIPLSYRMEMMSALQFVDYVTWFDEATPIALLDRIRPDIHVNGAEYGKKCIEAETVERYGGTIHIVELLPGLSTSYVIDKIRSS